MCARARTRTHARTHTHTHTHTVFFHEHAYWKMSYEHKYIYINILQLYTFYMFWQINKIVISVFKKKKKEEQFCTFSLSWCCSLQSYVREQILQTVAVILKRGTLETDHSCDCLFQDVTQLISSGNVTMVINTSSFGRSLPSPTPPPPDPSQVQPLLLLHHLP